MEHVSQIGVQYAKAGCYVCLNPNECVDVGAYIEGEGALALCQACLRDAIIALGWGDPKTVGDDYKLVQEVNAAQTQQIAQLKGELKRAKARPRAAEPVLA